MTQNNIIQEQFNDKIAIVTGGSRGIGRAIAVALAARGAQVIVADIDVNCTKQTSASGEDKCISYITTDISSEASISKLFSYVQRQFGKLDILVNNAGIFKSTPIIDITASEWDLVMAVNLRGTFLVSREALKLMIKNKSGKIINIASMSGKTGGITAGAHYAASKAAVICFTKSLAAQASVYKINVNAITPGLIQTDLTDAWGKETNARLTAAIPLKEFGQPQDVAELTAFLASERARYITGEIIDVNGGMLMD